MSNFYGTKRALVNDLRGIENFDSGEQPDLIVSHEKQLRRELIKTREHDLLTMSLHARLDQSKPGHRRVVGP